MLPTKDFESSLEEICGKFTKECELDRMILYLPLDFSYGGWYEFSENQNLRKILQSEFQSKTENFSESGSEWNYQVGDSRGSVGVIPREKISSDKPERKNSFNFYIQMIENLYVKELQAYMISENEDRILNHLHEIDNLYNNSPVGYVTLDYKGFIKKSNITFLDWVGLSRKIVLSKNFLEDFIVEEFQEAVQEFLSRIHLGKNLNDLEVEIKGSHQKKMVCMINGRSHFDKEYLARLSIFDITEKAKVQSLYNEEVNKVIQQNTILNRDLNIAAKIQKRLLPSKKIYPNIDYRYKPLDQLGGDFCDIFPFGEYIGIFISDVAGHGVPSAFVTAILKSSLDKAESYVKEDPAQLLSYLNESIVDFCDGRFVTAYYGIYHPKTRELIFSSAGHPAPLLMRGNNLIEIPMEKSGRPLGIFSSQDKNSRFLMYSNQTFSFDPKDRILFYTDGLMEASKIEDGNFLQYENFILEDLKNTMDLPLGEFMEKILQNQSEFLNGNPLEDDICMIGMDVV